MSARATDPRPPWRELLGEAASRRLARLASLRGEEELVWLGEGGEKEAKQLEKICETKVKVRTDLEGVSKRSLGLIVAPELVEQVGLEKALKELRPALETDGVLALVARAAIGDAMPEAERTLWEQRQHGPLETVMQVMSRFTAIGLETLTVEMFPLTGKLAPVAAQDAPAGDDAEAPSGPKARGVYGGVGLGLFIGRRIEPGSPPRWPRRAGME